MIGYRIARAKLAIDILRIQHSARVVSKHDQH